MSKTCSPPNCHILSKSGGHLSAVYLRACSHPEAETVSTEKSKDRGENDAPRGLASAESWGGEFLQGKWPRHTFHTAYLVSVMDSTLYRASDQPAWTPRAKPQQNKASAQSSIPAGPGHQLVNLSICTNKLFPRNMCFLKQCCRLCLLGSWICCQ